MTTLVEHAKKELELSGLFDPDSDYGGKIGDDVLAIIKLFASQGHSGNSAFLTRNVLQSLMDFQPLTPLTYEFDEWINVSTYTDHPLWQNKRKSSIFSVDGGKTHFDVNGEEPDWRILADTLAICLRRLVGEYVMSAAEARLCSGAVQQYDAAIEQETDHGES